MAEAEIMVKEEPLDYDYEGTATIDQETMDFVAAHLKIECDEPQVTDCNRDVAAAAPTNPFQIVAEQDNLITINAADFKSDDERIFIAGLRLKKFAKVHEIPRRCALPTIACPQCPALLFATIAQLDKHRKRYHVMINCVVCSYACSDCNELAAHMMVHQTTTSKNTVFESHMHTHVPKKTKLLNEMVFRSKTDFNSNLTNPFNILNEIKIKQEKPDFLEKTDRTRPNNNNPEQQKQQHPTTNAVNMKQQQIDIKQKLEECDYEIQIKTEPIWKTEEGEEILQESTKTSTTTISDSSTTSSSSPSSSYSAITASAKESYLESLRQYRLPVRKIPPKINNTNYNNNNNNNNDNNTLTAITSKPRPLQNIQILNGNFNFSSPISLKGFKVVKLAPNTKIVRLPTTKPPQLHVNLPSTSPPPLLSLNVSKQVAPNASSATLMPKLKAYHADQETKKRLSDRGITVTEMPNQTLHPDPQLSPPLVTVSLGSLQADTTIDAHDLKKLLSQVRQKAAKNEQRTFTLSNDVLKVIERIPEKRELIENMVQKIRNIEEQQQQQPSANCSLRSWRAADKLGCESSSKEDSSPSSTSTSLEAAVDPPTAAGSVGVVAPASIFLPAATKVDLELLKARQLNPNYRYRWICPHCQMQYVSKLGFCWHLKNLHAICGEQLEELIVEVRPIREVESSESLSAEELALIKQEPEPEPGSEPIRMSVSNKSKKKTFTCPKCERTCSSRTMLNDHIRSNCSRQPLYACTKCSKRFFSTSTLQCHMTIHTGELAHKCNFCEKRFRTRGQVTVHHRTHTGERPFMCQVCSQCFTHRETLISHLSRHIGMKRYKCYGCNKHFSCISGLKTHRDIRPETCGKVKLCTRAVGPRVRVVRGEVIFEHQPEINPYLRTEDPEIVLTDIQNHQV